LIAEAIAKTLLPPKTQVFGACLKQDKIGPRGSGIAGIGINVSTEQIKGLDVIPAQEIDRRLILGLLP
jgi:hypothetical protein